MATKKPAKKAPAKAGAAEPSSDLGNTAPESTHEHWKERRPFEFSEKEWKILEDVAESDVRGVADGRTHEARGVLRTCTAFLRAGKVPPKPINEWLMERLEAIAGDASPWGVPLLKRKAGQKNADEYWPQFLVASYYKELKDKGWKEEAAKLEVRDKMEGLVDNLSTDMVLNYYRKFFQKK